MLSPSPSPSAEEIAAAAVYRSPVPTHESIQPHAPDEHERGIHLGHGDRMSAAQESHDLGAGHRAQPFLPRLDIRSSTPLAEISPTSSGPSPSRSLPNGAIKGHTHLPALSQVKESNAKTMRDFYPTPISVGRREKLRLPQAARREDWPGSPRSSPTLSRASISPERERPHARGPSYGPANRAYSAIPPYPLIYPGHMGHPQGVAARSRLSIHPYISGPVDPGYYSARGVPQRLRLNMASERGFCGFSPNAASSVSPLSFKAPRKRADEVQLSVLNEVFERTSYPSTEEREELARTLRMTSRSVQIWFQNRRRAVKVEQQSAVQRAEADARMGRHPLPRVGYDGPFGAPPRGPIGSCTAGRRGSYHREQGGGYEVKRERASLEREMRE